VIPLIFAVICEPLLECKLLSILVQRCAGNPVRSLVLAWWHACEGDGFQFHLSWHQCLRISKGRPCGALMEAMTKFFRQRIISLWLSVPVPTENITATLRAHTAAYWHGYVAAVKLGPSPASTFEDTIHICGDKTTTSQTLLLYISITGYVW